MKNLQKLDDFQKLSKDNLIEEMMKDTIKGGCCRVTGTIHLPDGGLLVILDEDMDME